jgi:hypothetical protein
LARHPLYIGSTFHRHNLDNFAAPNRHLHRRLPHNPLISKTSVSEARDRGAAPQADRACDPISTMLKNKQGTLSGFR